GRAALTLCPRRAARMLSQRSVSSDTFRSVSLGMTAILPAMSSGRPRADRARRRIMAQRRAVAAAEVDHLEVELAPGAARKDAAEVALGARGRARARQSPAAREAVDVGVDRERRFAERLREDHERRLPADAGERHERL